jgi:hypothetical protein
MNELLEPGKRQRAALARFRDRASAAISFDRLMTFLSVIAAA